MEVGTEEETQTVLLEGMEGTQYIIQRPDGDIGKSAFLTLSGELISDEGMVVDMMSAGVGSEYNTATQYFEGEDLLTQDMTEVTKTFQYFKVLTLFFLPFLMYLCSFQSHYFSS